MKPVIKIIILSIVMVILICVLVLSLVFSDFNSLLKINCSGINVGGFYTYNDSTLYTGGGGTVSGDIRELEIDWISGSVKIEVYDGEEVEIVETSDYKDDPDKQLYWRFDGTKLSIKFCRSGLGMKLFDNFGNKSVTLKIPTAMAEALSDIEIDSVSANIDIGAIKVGDLEIDSTSGKVKVEGITADSTDITTVSGDIDYSCISTDNIDFDTTSGKMSMKGSFKYIECDGVSAGTTVEAANCPESIDVDTVNGTVRITLPENEGFEIDYDNVNGDLECDFPTVKRDGIVIYQNGSAKISVNSVNGDLIIKKAE